MDKKKLTLIGIVLIILFVVVFSLANNYYNNSNNSTNPIDTIDNNQTSLNNDSNILNNNDSNINHDYNTYSVDSHVGDNAVNLIDRLINGNPNKDGVSTFHQLNNQNYVFNEWYIISTSSIFHYDSYKEDASESDKILSKYSIEKVSMEHDDFLNEDYLYGEWKVPTYSKGKLNGYYDISTDGMLSLYHYYNIKD